jgi:hypothetical protein
MSQPNGLLLDGRHPRVLKPSGAIFEKVPEGTPGAVCLPDLGWCLIQQPLPYTAKAEPSAAERVAEPAEEAARDAAEMRRKKGKGSRKAAQALEDLGRIEQGELDRIRAATLQHVVFQLPIGGGRCVKLPGRFQEILETAELFIFVQPLPEVAVELTPMDQPILVQITEPSGHVREIEAEYLNVSFELPSKGLRFVILHRINS